MFVSCYSVCHKISKLIIKIFYSAYVCIDSERLLLSCIIRSCDNTYMFTVLHIILGSIGSRVLKKARVLFWCFHVS